MNITLDFHRAEGSDLPEIKKLLEEHRLPVSDVETSDISFFVLREGHRLLACAGIEYFGTSGLLRSVAVLPELTGKGIGSAFVDYLISEVRKRNVHTLYLLTETAEIFFTRKGFSKTDRDFVPDSLKASSEFSKLCPSTAVCMQRKI